MTKIKNKTVLVTGGADGIGKLIGEKCLKKGASKLIIWDINETLLQQVTTDLTKKGLITTPYGVLDPNPSSTDKLIPRNLGIRMW